MMNPRDFEQYVAELFRMKGYQVDVTSASNDGGVDVIATRGDEKLAIQVKMYGGSSRKVNRQAITELHGSMALMDCTGAVIATDGELLSEAVHAAKKLRIDVLLIDPDWWMRMPDHGKSPGQEVSSATGNEPHISLETPQPETSGTSPDPGPAPDALTFDQIWRKHIMPLKGKKLQTATGRENTILDVNWSEVKRITSNGKQGKLPIEIFRFAVNTLLKQGYISRDTINQNYAGRGSSGIVMILSHVPIFELVKHPKTGLRLR